MADSQPVSVPAEVAAAAVEAASPAAAASAVAAAVPESPAAAPQSVVNVAASMLKVKKGTVEIFTEGMFSPEASFYPRVRNSVIHPLVAMFLKLGNERVIQRYCHLHPDVQEAQLREVLAHQPKHFRWAGCDSFLVTSSRTHRKHSVIVETNSCPSGNKSMPLLDENQEQGGFHKLLSTTFAALLRGTKTADPATAAAAEAEAGPTDPTPDQRVPGGVLAVIYDKNKTEAMGYASAMADLAGERVYLAEFYLTDPDPPVRWTEDGVLEVRISKTKIERSDRELAAYKAAGGGEEGDEDAEDRPPPVVIDGAEADAEWVPVRAAFRYVTQRPWTRLPVRTKTVLLNPIIACLAGGRNKLVAAKAYDLFNADLKRRGVSGLCVRVPTTINDVRKAEVPLWIERFGGQGVVKVPYSNAGQGVYVCLNDADLAAFMSQEHHYDTFIVQSLIGNSTWGSRTPEAGRYFHVGTVPNKRGKIFVADVRMMVSATPAGFQPIAVYARRAREPLTKKVPKVTGKSWSMLGTNLSKMTADLTWTSESDRLVLMDRKDFNQLGLGLDELIETYIQTVLAAQAIDHMAQRLVLPDGHFNWELFQSLNDDPALLEEIMGYSEFQAASAAAAGGGAGQA